MNDTNEFLPSGRFTVVTANYWASHAGIAMWRNWQPEVVDRDFALLAKEGLQMLRVFPLWPDFQPIHLLRGYLGNAVEFRHGENALLDTEAIQDGVSREMLDRFSTLADTAAKYDLELIVGLVTGWMSGRLFMPPALEALNPITSPLSQMWQTRFVRTFVSRFKKHPAIKAWDLGNECNCMAPATREEAWAWASALANVIRASDSSRPVISGMHSLTVNPQGPWSIRDQGEVTDILTTHPYPSFTPHNHREPLNTMRPALHATAETCLYADLGAKPAFVEEFGELGPMVGGTAAAPFLRTCLPSLWAHDCRAALWWCAHDAPSLDEACYDWTVVERELGLVRKDGTIKPALREIQAFRKALAGMPFDKLPQRRKDAVCILTPGQDNWGVAYSTFVLAKQAGFDIQFHYADRALPDAELYLLPSLHGYGPLMGRREDELWAKVRAGATAYVSLADGVLGRFAEATGLEVSTRAERKGKFALQLPDGASLDLQSPLQYEFKIQTAEVIASEADDRPVFCKNSLGKGRVFLLAAPLETHVAAEPQLFAGDDHQPFWQIYRTFADTALAKRIVRKNSPWLGITEHAFEDGKFVAILINYSRQSLDDILSVPDGFHASDIGGSKLATQGSPQQYRIHLEPNSHAVWQLSQEKP